MAGQTPQVTDDLCKIYKKVTSGGVFRAADIKTAEAAKVVENAQRDINIAFVNEVATIFHKMGISIHDVLEAAGTKWNFLNFRPGLVGGHCIGVDPFYLAHAAVSAGHHQRLYSPAVVSMMRWAPTQPLALLSPEVSRARVQALVFLCLASRLKKTCPISVIRG